MLDIDPNSDLAKAIASDATVIPILLFEIDYADGPIPKEYLTTMKGNVTHEGKTYVQFPTPIAIDPPKPTASAVDQGLFSLALAPRDDVEFRVMMNKWTGVAYPQEYDFENPSLPGISMKVKLVFPIDPISSSSSESVWFRDSAADVYENRETPVGTDNTCDIVRAWVNFHDQTPIPRVAIAPEALPAGLFTATAGSSTVATEPTYFQFLRYGSELHGGLSLFLEFGTAYEYANFDTYHAASTSKNRWLTPAAEASHTISVLNRRTQERRDIPISSMTRGPGNPNYNYILRDPDLEDFFLSLPNFNDSSLPRAYREHGARISLRESYDVKVAVTDALVLQRGKLHSVVPDRARSGGRRIILTFSSPFEKMYTSASRSLTQSEQEAIDKTDKFLEQVDNAAENKWSVES